MEEWKWRIPALNPPGSLAEQGEMLNIRLVELKHALLGTKEDVAVIWNNRKTIHLKDNGGKRWSLP